MNKGIDELKQLRINVEQLTVQRDHAQRQRKELQSTVEQNGVLRLRMYDSLMIEKLDLMGRIARIDQRIMVLGLKPALTANSAISLDGISELGSDERAK